MRDAADATHALEGSIRPKALEMLLAFMCEGECEIDEGQLTEVLAIGSRLAEGRAGGRKKRIKKPPMGVGLEEEREDAKKHQKAPYGSRTHDLRITSATLYH